MLYGPASSLFHCYVCSVAFITTATAAFFEFLNIIEILPYTCGLIYLCLASWYIKRY